MRPVSLAVGASGTGGGGSARESQRAHARLGIRSHFGCRCTGLLHAARRRFRRLLHLRKNALIRPFHISHRNAHHGRLARGQIRQIEQINREPRVLMLHLHIWRARAPGRRLLAVAVETGDLAELLKLCGDKIGPLRRHFRHNMRRHVLRIRVLQLAFDDPPLGVFKHLARRLIPAFNLLAFHVHVDDFLLRGCRRPGDVLLRRRDRDRRQAHQIVVIADFAFQLLDLHAVLAELLFGGDEVLDLALAVLDQVQHACFHGAQAA